MRDLGEEETAARAADLAASYEHAIVETLILRVKRALREEPGARLAIGGGVAANRLLRERARELGVDVKVPPPALCTDNAAMIGSAARWVEPVPVPGLPGARRLRHGGMRSSRCTAARAATCATTPATTLQRVRSRAPVHARRARHRARRRSVPAPYLERIPVICLDGDELYDFVVDEDDLTRRLGLL